MTVRTRNKVYLIFFIISLIFMISAIAGAVFLTNEGLMHRTGLEPNEWAVASSVIAILMFLCYVPAAAGFICFGFEKTSSDEIVFFLIFLICCFFEGVRLLFPYQELYLAMAANFKIIYPASGLPDSSVVLMCMSKFVIFVRAMAYLSLLCMPVFPLIKKYMTVEELLALACAISVLTAAICKIRVNEFQTNYTHAVANYSHLIWAIIFVFTATFMLVGNYINFRMKKRVPESLGYLGTVIGHLTLTHAYSFPTLVISASVFFLGTIVYLRNIHSRLNNG